MLVIDIVAAPLNVLLKLFAVERSNVAEPPDPKSLNVSLYVVEFIYPLPSKFPVKLILPVWLYVPVNDNILPSNVNELSTFPLRATLSYVNIPLFVLPIKPNPDEPPLPEVPDVKLAGVVPEVPDVPVCPLVPEVTP